jgi:hypothetical protein
MRLAVMLESCEEVFLTLSEWGMGFLRPLRPFVHTILPAVFAYEVYSLRAKHDLDLLVSRL